MTDDDIAHRQNIATGRRQEFEELQRLAWQRRRPADYDAAMQAAIEYVAVLDGLLAALIRERQARLDGKAVR